MHQKLQKLLQDTRQLIAQELSDVRWINTTPELANFFNSQPFKQESAQARTTPAPRPAPKPVARPRPTPRPRPKAPTPKQPPKPEAPAKPSTLPSFEEKPPLEKAQLDPIRAFLMKACPDLRLIDQPPDDSRAKAVGMQWKGRKTTPTIVLLSDSQSPQEQNLLKNLAHALSTQYAPAQLIRTGDLDRKQAWERFLENEDVQVVIAPERLTKTHHELKDRAHNGRLNERLHLFHMDEAASYIQDATRKAGLWQNLSQTLKVWLET